MKLTYKTITYCRDNDNKAISYAELVSNSEKDIIKWLYQQGMCFKHIWGCECHDIGNTDFLSGSVNTYDVDEILSLVNKLFGEWKINAIYKGVAITIRKMYPNIMNNLSFTYPKAQEQTVLEILAEFEKNFCYPEVKECERDR